MNFLYISRASLSEAEYLLNLSFKLGYLDQISFKDLEKKREETAKTLVGLIVSVQKEVK